MTAHELELHAPPDTKRALELWLQHAAGRILFENVRSYALSRVAKRASAEAKSVAEKAINDAVYGLMMVIDGVTGSLRNETHAVELSVRVRLVDRKSTRSIAELDLRDGDGMCMGFHGWLEGDFGSHPVAVLPNGKPKPKRKRK